MFDYLFKYEEFENSLDYYIYCVDVFNDCRVFISGLLLFEIWEVVGVFYFCVYVLNFIFNVYF